MRFAHRVRRVFVVPGCVSGSLTAIQTTQPFAKALGSPSIKRRRLAQL